MSDFLKSWAVLPTKLERALTWLLIAMLAVLAALSFGYSGLKILRLGETETFWLSGCAVLFALCISLFLFRALKNAPMVVITIVTFLIALLPRILFGTLADCTPVSDFFHYHQFAFWLGEGNRQAVADIAQKYQLAEFSGLAALNYSLSLLFSTSVGGMRFASAILSSLICIVVFQLGAQYKKSCGLAAALFYAWYPASIVASQILTNQHGATLFALLSLLSLLKCVRMERMLPAMGYAVLGGTLLVVSHFFHPSSITTQIAVICFLGITAFQKRRPRLMQIFYSIICFLLSFQLVLSGCLGMLRSAQLLPQALETDSALPKIVVGLNPETKGAYSADDYMTISALPPEERNTYCLQLIGERLSHPIELLNTLASKTFSMWVRTDNLFLFYEQGVESSADTARTQSAFAWSHVLQLWDCLYTAFLYMGAAAGLYYALRRRSYTTAIRLLVWVLSGWIGVHMLSEVQPRYRYYSMPMLTILWGGGLVHFRNALGRRLKKTEPAKK